MDILKGQSPNSFDKVRDKSLSLNSSISKNTLMSSTKSFVAYHDRMKQNNDMVVDKDTPNNNASPELSYKTAQEQALYLSKAAENQMNIRPI